MLIFEEINEIVVFSSFSFATFIKKVTFIFFQIDDIHPNFIAIDEVVF